MIKDFERNSLLSTHQECAEAEQNPSVYVFLPSKKKTISVTGTIDGRSISISNTGRVCSFAMILQDRFIYHTLGHYLATVHQS